ncbi:hypothetical protein BC332_02611 [Capsicum chinense]|nr:hypothetical protein BC332_02611 [Capsicum chinense]
MAKKKEMKMVVKKKLMAIMVVYGKEEEELNVIWDCGVFVFGYTEYLSEEIIVPSVDFEVEYHRMRYMSLLQNYDLQKAKKCYVSDNDDSPRPRTKYVLIPDETRIVSIE